MVRHNNQLPNNLPQLQNLIKRDPPSYKDDFLQQHQYYQSLVKLFCLQPSEFNKNLSELVMFLAQVSHCYPDVLENYPQELTQLLQNYSTSLDPGMRMIFCRALILLRNKNVLSPTDLLSLFFQLLKCRDKSLRQYLETHIITDIKNLNAKHKNARLNTTLQNFMYSMLKENNLKAAKMSLNIMIELYKKNIWNDAKTVNVIASACFSKFTKVMVTALKFFTNINEEDNKSDNSDSEDEISAKDVIMANKVNKKTRKREKNLKKVKQLVEKRKKKKAAAPSYNFSALHLIHDPQGMAEKLYQQLQSRHERFEVKLLTQDVISRLIGVHQLIVLNFYPLVQQFLQPHQREVTKILQYTAQACHELVPPDVVEPVLKTLVNNFVTERNSSDVIAIGLNAVRELCSRCPLAMNEDLLRDLVQYKNYRDRSVKMAARSLIHLFRISMPKMLRKKDRGRPTEATIELQQKKYGAVDAKEYVPGAEVLFENTEPEGDKTCVGNEESDEEWIDVSHSSDDEQEGELSSDGEEVSDEEDNTSIGDEDSEDNITECDMLRNSSLNEESVLKGENAAAEESRPNIDKEDTHISKDGHSAKSDNVEKAMQASLTRILSDEDFRKIEAAQIRKEMTTAKKGVKRPAPPEQNSKNELVSLADIENIYKKRRHDKQARIESVRKGQQDREKHGFQVRRQNPFASTTNREKSKKKNFMMLRQKARGKVKRSFKEKQIALRNHLLKLKRMK